jgi:membrane fusion protein, adhesin transport system
MARPAKTAAAAAAAWSRADLGFDGADGAARRLARRFRRVLAFVFVVLVGGLLAWAAVFETDVITRGEGKIVAAGQNKVVQSYEGGVLREVLVREGDTVREGQPLMRVESTPADAQAQERLAKYHAFAARAARLRAEYEGKPQVEFPPELAAAAPNETRAEAALFRTRAEQLRSELFVLEQQIEQREQAVRQSASTIRRLEARFASMRQELGVMLADYRAGSVSLSEVQKQQRDTEQVGAELRTERIAYERAEAALREARQRLAERKNAFRTEVSKELNDAEREVAALRPQIEAGAGRVTRTELKSPVAGTIKTVGVVTPGTAIRPGQALIEIVPSEDTLMVEARIRPKDRAFIRPDQPATVKISAYDYGLYGGLDGRVVDVSADAIQDEKKKDELYYRVRIRTERAYLERDGARLPIIAGMTAQVDIKTSRRTILDQVLDPFVRLFSDSLGER